MVDVSFASLRSHDPWRPIYSNRNHGPPEKVYTKGSVRSLRQWEVAPMGNSASAVGKFRWTYEAERRRARPSIYSFTT